MTDIIDSTTGGKWWIKTRDSHHILDLDNWIYRRIPGPKANVMADDPLEQVHYIEPFGVGDRMKMTMASGNYNWRVSSVVQSIEPYEWQDRN